jgi:hypothetical protein
MRMGSVNQAALVPRTDQRDIINCCTLIKQLNEAMMCTKGLQLTKEEDHLRTMDISSFEEHGTKRMIHRLQQPPPLNLESAAVQDSAACEHLCTAITIP